MNFDVAIIGGGLAGLVCGITLQEQGKRCVIINNGQAAIDFSSGSLDLLGHLPNGKQIIDFQQDYEDLVQQAPQHPYSIIGKEKVIEKVHQFEKLAQNLNLSLIGSFEQGNHFRVTPLGGLRPTWLSPNSVPSVKANNSFPYKKIIVLGVEGYHDFQPQLLADNLVQQTQFAHCEISTGYLNIPQLDQLRQNSREFRSVNIAQLLEHKLAFQDLVSEIKDAAKDAEAVFLPACFGLDTQEFFSTLKQATKLELFELPTLPPSLLGIRQHKQLTEYFKSLGGFMMNGNKVVKADIDNHKITCVYTQLHQEVPIKADNFVLATGSFFSKGLVAEFEKIYEPIFALDMFEQDNFNIKDRLTWTNSRFSSSQPYHSTGVIIDTHCRAQKDNQFFENLYAIGNIVGGFNGIELGCGSGVAIVTALVTAEKIGGK
ncbi:glycerol-3-phosphate dehydrogenase subunit GlpB [[Haemophilus] felis]|uniref:Anaerobic glycerol-3-phosphate dehydrogenase subunit B n=1 Tax=[Haemophilus] felis TaxID=123822 RepID=A0A1T0B066_9PAST|nr:glycerol-3-phosphate dehydrogenase subunit GlpB [[Haemophilus] felis]NBI40088.1 glycerol-3-phosphate dehydrogenase subunit GlpB [[Haemophilus] felis]OOS03462.1 anaerobic glycerol-3-phosphate dehydrogenase subunit B [[Haemophilus] felis]